MTPRAPVATAAPAAKRSVGLAVEDMTRKQTWFEDALREELPKSGFALDPSAPYVLHVSVDQRGSVQGVALEKSAVARGSNRLNGALDEQQSEEYRDSPSLERPLYSGPPRSPTDKTPQAVDDFRIAATATLTKRGSTAVVAQSSFDERALGLAPVDRADRPKEWQTIYRELALRVAAWLKAQPLP